MTFGLDLDYLYKTPIKIGEGIAGLIALTKKPISVTNIARDKRIKYVNYLLKEGVRSMLGVPILFNSQLLGVLMTYSRQECRFSEQEMGLFATFASQAAIAINNAKMHESLHRTYIDTIKALVLAMESRYPYMKGHSTRVTRYAVRIARQMKLSDTDMEMLHYTGYIHDVGKIAIPDAILNKPAKLTPSERAIIELHPIKGQEMLLPLKFLDKGIPAVRHHHERYDGNGYPDGLEKKKIPLGARILGAADAFDAMTSERPYRPKMQLKEAIKELEVNSGSQFDPEVVSVFIRILKK
jgi:putative nucleotidyltransferase with HDIG domain